MEMFIKKYYLVYNHFEVSTKIANHFRLLKLGLERLSMLEPRPFGFKEHDPNSCFALPLHHLLAKG